MGVTKLFNIASRQKLEKSCDVLSSALDGTVFALQPLKSEWKQKTVDQLVELMVTVNLGHETIIHMA